MAHDRRAEVMAILQDPNALTSGEVKAMTDSIMQVFGYPSGDAAEQLKRVIDESPNWVNAVKKWRDLTNCSLREAVDAIKGAWPSDRKWEIAREGY